MVKRELDRARLGSVRLGGIVELHGQGSEVLDVALCLVGRH